MSAITLTEENFSETVLSSDKPVLVDFWAPWCGPCKAMGPIVEELAGERDDIVIGKLNVDDHGPLAQRYGILSIPTFMLFKKGEAIDQFAGMMDKDQLVARIEAKL